MNKLKKIMIVGGGELQIPVIEAAKKLGYTVIVSDMDENAPGMLIADIKAVISTIDADKILEFAHKNEIDGIVTAATDFPIRSVAATAQALNLVGISEDTAIKATNKRIMRKCLKDAGVSVPDFYGIKNFDEIIELTDKIDKNKKYIMKPVDNSGSRGVFFIDNLRDFGKLREIYDYSRDYSRSGEVLIEEYMYGDEISVETFCVDGECIILQITDKVTSKEPYFVEKMHIQPSKYEGKIKEDIVYEVKRALKALGINNGPAHTEVMVTNEGPKIVEVGARTAGDHISSELLYLSTGIDLAKNLVLFSLGEDIDLERKCDKASVIKYIEAEEGSIKSIYGLEDAKSVEGVYSIKLLKNVGESISKVKNSTDRIGYIIAYADKVDKAVEIAYKAQELIKIEV